MTHGKSVNGGSPHTCQRKREWRRYAEEMNSEKTRPNKRNWVQNGSLHFIVGDTIFSLKLAYMGDRPIPRQRGIGRKIPLESLPRFLFALPVLSRGRLQVRGFFPPGRIPRHRCRGSCAPSVKKVVWQNVLRRKFSPAFLKRRRVLLLWRGPIAGVCLFVHLPAGFSTSCAIKIA